MENKTKKITKYTSRAELIEDIVNWNDISVSACKEAEYIQTLKDIHTRLLRSDGKKLPLAEFIQKNKLSQVELFLLLRISILCLQRLLNSSFFQIPSLLTKGQIFGTRQEVLSILLDHKSVLFTEGIFTSIGDRIELKRNFLVLPVSKKPKTKKRTLNPKRVLAELNKYVIGQDEAKKKLVAGVFEHLTKCASAKDGQFFNKSNIFISGPTGTGKTYMCQCLARILKIPFIHADASQYTQTGYVGMDVSDILRPLISHASAGKMPIAIVFIDEIDKIRQGSESHGGAASTNVQVELLRLIESTRFRLQDRSFIRNVMNFDISKVLFIVGGAFESLQVKHADKSVGFTHAPIVKKETLTADDFIAYGMLPELIGRFSYFVQLKGLEKEDLRKILFNPHNGPLQQYKDLLHTSNKVSPKTLETLLNNACERHLGARGLHQQVGQLFQTQFLEKAVQIEI
ncbi:MAG: AAA family ATPase [Elusimicrobiaceae bacterium]|nr:AAA family ATPase [Elusimicrobiaceae bacterium]